MCVCVCVLPLCPRCPKAPSCRCSFSQVWTLPFDGGGVWRIKTPLKRRWNLPHPPLSATQVCLTPVKGICRGGSPDPSLHPSPETPPSHLPREATIGGSPLPPSQRWGRRPEGPRTPPPPLLLGNKMVSASAISGRRSAIFGSRRVGKTVSRAHVTSEYQLGGGKRSVAQACHAQPVHRILRHRYVPPPSFLSPITARP